MINSLDKSDIVNTVSKDTLSDGSAGGVENGSITHDLCKRYIDKTCLVNEQEIALQISKTLKDEKIIVEGAAAVAIASFIKMRKDIRDLKNIVIIVCGGNICKKTLKSVL